MSQQILFDLDDTLIYCNRYFFRTIDRFAEQLYSWFQHPELTTQQIKDKQAEIDTLLISQTGFKSSHFPQSFIETYEYYSNLFGRIQKPTEKDLLTKIALNVYEHKIEPYPYMDETLQQLQDQGHQLHLYTGGENVIQTRKIDEMGLTRYFEDRVYIRQMKNISALDDILTKQSFDRERTWMIGNSIRNDIIPAFHAGIHAIHIEVPEEWVYNNIKLDVQPSRSFQAVTSLQQIPPIIAQQN